MNFTMNIGMLLLALYLILVGIIATTGVVIPSIVLGILALLAGIMILVGRQTGTGACAWLLPLIFPHARLAFREPFHRSR